jgi:GDP-D-mannose dehydratase
MRLIEKEKPDIIFHIASIANVRESFDNPTTVVKNNINITLNLLEVIRLLKIKNNYNPTIQICSTSEVYGNADSKFIPINEECPLAPINPYAVSKLTQDSLSYVYYLNYGLKIIRTRMFSYLNAKRNNLFATSFAVQILKIQKGEQKILEHGSLNSKRTLLDVRDAVEAYWIASTKGKIGEVYNIGASEIISVKDVLNRLIRECGTEIKTKESNSLIRPSDISIQIPDCSKFYKQTKWKPKYNLDESFKYFWEEVRSYWS